MRGKGLNMTQIYTQVCFREDFTVGYSGNHQATFPFPEMDTIDNSGFLAITLNMGIVKVPEIKDYWKTSWESHIPFFSRVMPRDRFGLIFWMLHAEGSIQ